jgi:hypothetical protein
VEDTRLVSASGDGKTELEIEVLRAPAPGQDIRPVGSDIALGSKAGLPELSWSKHTKTGEKYICTKWP